MCHARHLDASLCYDSSAASLAGLPASQLRRLQLVLNAPARLIYRSPCYEHVTPMLQDLHWLRSPERIDFKLAVLVYRYLHGLAPRYLSDHIQRVADSNRRSLVVVVIAASDTAHNCWRSRIPGRRQPLMEQFAARCHLITDACRVSQSSKTYLFMRSFPS